MTRERLASMTDDELLAYERERHGSPYMDLATANILREAAGLEPWPDGDDCSVPDLPRYE